MNSASQDFDHHLSQLRLKLQHPADYEQAFYHFIEEFGGDEAFVRQSIEATMPLLTQAISQIVTQLVSRPVRLDQAKMLRLPGHPFYHGNGLIDGRTVIILFFEDLNLGLATLIPGVHGAAEFARFSLPQTAPANPSQN